MGLCAVFSEAPRASALFSLGLFVSWLALQGPSAIFWMFGSLLCQVFLFVGAPVFAFDCFFARFVLSFSGVLL